MSSEPNDQTPDEFETGDITPRIVSLTLVSGALGFYFGSNKN